jgi:hypothetical protein
LRPAAVRCRHHRALAAASFSHRRSSFFTPARMASWSENAPTTVLDAWLKAMAEKRGRNELKPANLYQGSIFAWNAFREGKTITTIKYDTKKGLHPINE